MPQPPSLPHDDDRDIRALTTGQRPALEEQWYCPNCGRPAICYVSVHRTIACESCAWIFDVRLVTPLRDEPDPLAAARRHAETAD